MEESKNLTQDLGYQMTTQNIPVTKVLMPKTTKTLKYYVKLIIVHSFPVRRWGSEHKDSYQI